MTRNQSCHLLDMLAEVPDPRKKKGLRHPSETMLGVLVVGLLCDQKGYTCIATWLRTQPALAKALGFRHRKTPCGGTFHNLLKALDVVKHRIEPDEMGNGDFSKIPLFVHKMKNWEKTRN